MVLSSIADVSCNLFLVLRLPLPQHWDGDFEKNSSTGAGYILVFWDEMFLVILGFWSIFGGNFQISLPI